MENLIKERIYTVEVDLVNREKWCQVLANFADASIYQTWEYGVERWGKKNLSHMVVRKNGEIISAAQVRILRIPALNTGMAYITYGPMWKTNSSVRDIENFRAGLQALIDEYAVSRGLFLRVRPWGFDEIDEDMAQTLFNLNFDLTKGIFRNKKRTILVDLSLSEVDLRRRLRKSWRQTLQRAEKENMRIIEGFDERIFRDFKKLYFDMLEYKKFKPGTDINELERIQEKLIPSQKMRVTICEFENIPISGSVCSSIGDTVIGLFSATSEAGRKKSAYYLLQWEEILWSKKTGKFFYDLGGINPVKNPGVYTFKSGIGGKEVSFLGVFDFCQNRLLYKTIMGFESLLLLWNQIV